MREVDGNLWDFYDSGKWIAITTNGTVKKDGSCVMGSGVAHQAKMRFPMLQYDIGYLINHVGNVVHPLKKYRIITFPVKQSWWDLADIKLIVSSCLTATNILNHELKKIGVDEIYMPKPGCGRGGLDWCDVKPIVEKYLGDGFVIVRYGYLDGEIREYEDPIKGTKGRLVVSGDADE